MLVRLDNLRNFNIQLSVRRVENEMKNKWKRKLRASAEEIILYIKKLTRNSKSRIMLKNLLRKSVKLLNIFFNWFMGFMVTAASCILRKICEFNTMSVFLSRFPQ